MKTIEVTSDRELDALVAEHIFNWKVYTRKERDFKESDNDIKAPCWAINLDQVEVWSFPNYSTDGNAMLEILNKSGCFEVEQYGSEWIVMFDADRGEAESLPKAVCLAALCAKNIKVTFFKKT